MLLFTIEKEIAHDNKVFGNFTIRQAIFTVISAVAILLFYMITNDIVFGMICASPVAALCIYLGFYNIGGLSPEEIALKKIESKFFKNEIRKYRTKNQYFQLMNRAYAKGKKVQSTTKPKGKNEVAEKVPASQIKSY